MRVLVVRSGSAWHADASKLSTKSSQGNHTAVARTIAEAGHDVCCSGRITGDLGIGDQITWSGAIPDCEEYCKAVERWAPEVIVNVCGGDTTCSSPNNPRGIKVRDCEMRFSWPMFEMLSHTKMPRVVVITDPRCYPRDQEMTWNEWAVPVAVLSQQDVIFKRRILDRKFVVHAVHSGAENLRLQWTPRVPADSRDRVDVALVAHSHIGDSRVGDERDSVWAWIFAGLDSCSLEVYGTGWEGWPGWRGETRDVQETFARGLCCPMIAMDDGWVSPKYRECALAGSLPLPYGRGKERYSYDRQGHLCPIDHETRFSTPEELRALIYRCGADERWRRRMVEEALERSRPDPSVLLRCVKHFGEGGEKTLEFGGYYEWITGAV